MHASMHTCEVDPAVTWRIAGLGKTANAHREPQVAVGPVDTAPAPEFVTAAAMPLQAPRGSSWPSHGEAMEFGCFMATLAAVSLLQFGVLALVM